jgi:hypothetical protein
VVFGIMTLVTGRSVGAQGVGRLVGVGRAAHVEPHAVDDLRRLPAAAALRRPGLGQARRGMALFGMANVPFIFVSVNVLADAAPADLGGADAAVQMGGPLWFCISRSSCCSCAAAACARGSSAARRIEDLYLAEDEA